MVLPSYKAHFEIDCYPIVLVRAGFRVNYMCHITYPEDSSSKAKIGVYDALTMSDDSDKPPISIIS